MKNVQKKFSLNKTTKSNFITYGIVIAAFVIMEILMAAGMVSSLLKGLLVPICVYVIMAISLNLTVGVLGELSLGHAGFMSVGAFSGAVVSMMLQNAIPEAMPRLLISLAVGAIFAAIVGVLVGIPVLRLNGDYLAIVTLAFGEIIKSLITNMYIGMDENGLHFSMIKQRFELAEGGRMLIDGPIGLSGMRKVNSFTVGIILILLCLMIIFHLVNSKSGRAIMALRDNRIAAESVGINVTKYKMMGFVISAAMAGAAGALFASNYSALQASKFDFNTSILVLVFVVLGGLGNMRGSVIAAALLTVLPELLRAFSDYRMLAYAVVLIGIMLVTHNPAIADKLEQMKIKMYKSSATRKKSALTKKSAEKEGK